MVRPHRLVLEPEKYERKYEQSPAYVLTDLAENAVSLLVGSAIIVVDNNGEHNRARAKHRAVHDPGRNVMQVRSWAMLSRYIQIVYPNSIGAVAKEQDGKDDIPDALIGRDLVGLVRRNQVGPND